MRKTMKNKSRCSLRSCFLFHLSKARAVSGMPWATSKTAIEGYLLELEIPPRGSAFDGAA